MSLELVKVLDAPSLDLVSEANHRIANHLAMIAGLMRSQGARIFEKRQAMTAQEVRLTLEEFAARLETVGKIHRLLSHSDDADPIDVDPYLRSIAERILSSLSHAGEIELQCDLRASCVLSSEKAITLGLLVGELVTNAVKYAHPAGVAGKISVDASMTREGFILINVSDDGVGFPEGLDPLEGGGMGLRIVKGLTAKLGGTISFDNHGLGLSCTLLAPHGRVELRAVS
jgi:two-component sensor histidine kinase